MDLVARHFETGSWVRVTVDGPTIAAVTPVEGPAEVWPDDDWIGPAFWDLQFNGRWGVSFSDPELTVEQVAAIVQVQAELGSARVCPTLITAPFASLRSGLTAIAAACDQDPRIAARVLGIHLEGPYISSLDGYRGAHPLEAVRDPDWDEFQRLQEAADGRVVLLTLAPERPGAIAFIRKAVASGIVVALGHTAADGTTIRAAVEAGARLSTHLGNGIASVLPRHPNPIWEQAAELRLFASLIADGHHLDLATLSVLYRAKYPQAILVSDASSLAGLSPGTYGPWAVDPSGKIVVAGTPYLAGSNQGLEVGLNTLLCATSCGIAPAFRAVTTAPALLLGRTPPIIEPGAPANLVVFRCSGDGLSDPLRLLRTCVDGAWCEARDDTPAPWVVPSREGV